MLPPELEARLKKFLEEVFDPSLTRPIKRERRRALGFAEGYARAMIDAGLLTPEKLKGHLDRAKYMHGVGADDDSTSTD